MKHLRIFEDYIDDLFPKGQSPRKDYLPGLTRISNELLSPVAVNLNRGSSDSQRLALMISELARLLIADPLKLDEIINSVDREELYNISQTTQSLPDDWTPPGYDQEGFEMFVSLQESFLDNPAGVAGFFSVPETPVYSLGVMLYYLFLSTFKDDAFTKMEEIFGL